MNKKKDIHCPICHVAMIVSTEKNKAGKQIRKSRLLCPSCGKDVKTAFKAGLANKI